MRKTTIKKIIPLVLAASMFVMATGCGANENVEETKTPEDSQSEANEVIVEESETKEDLVQEEISEDETVDMEESADDSNEPSLDDEYSARVIIDEMIFGWNLGNTLDAYSGAAGVLRDDGLKTENCWGNPTTSQELIDTVKDTGINVIRIPVTWYTHMDSETYEIDSEWMARTKEIVDYAIDDNTYVIINMHHDTGTNGWLKASDNNLEWKKEVFASAWSQIADAFKDYDSHLLFEGYNEILNDQNEWSNPDSHSIDIVNELAQIFVDTVRATGGNNANRVLIVNPYCSGCGVAMLKNFKIPADSVDDALIVEVHAYSPYDFTAPEFPNVTTYKDSDITDTLKYVNNVFSEANVPVLIGEFGAVPKNNDPERLAWAKLFVETAASYGMPCIWWDNGILNEFAIIDRNNKNVAYEELLQVMLDATGK